MEVTEPSDSGPKLRSSLANNEKFKNVLEKFVARLPERIEEMQRLLGEKDLDNLGRAVHQLKGAAGGYGFPEITSVAGEAMESIRHAAAIEEIAPQVQTMIALIRQVDGFPASVNAEPQKTGSVSAPLQVEFKSRVDSETGAATREYLMERLSAEISFARREVRSLSCIVIEIDQFATLQQQSPESADAAIKRLAKMLARHCQGDCTLFRVEAHVFAITAPRCNTAAAWTLVEQIKGEIAAEPFEEITGNFKLSCVFGVSQLTQSTTSGKSLFDAAHPALVAA
jgi:diguanylate cyclase (GGDEF)-like protein